jgi:Fe-S oxidoreductase
VLDRLGLDYEVLDSGCCGLAGSFGYEAGEKYDISMRAGERVLLPAVRAEPNALIVTDGFSCRSQIEHGTGRRALHLAEVAAMALRQPVAPASRRRGRPQSAD